MVVFIESTILQNFAITYLFLKIICLYQKCKVKKITLVFACLFSSFVALIFPLFEMQPFLLIISKLIIGFLICSICFNVSLKKLFFYYILFIFLTAIYGGINLMVYYSLFGSFASKTQMPSYVVLVCFAVVTYFLNQIWQKNKTDKHLQFVLQAKIINKNKTIKTKAYFDSGNVLQHPQTKEPICLINYRLFFQIFKDVSILDVVSCLATKKIDGEMIEIETATGKDKILTFSVDCLTVCVNNHTKEIKNAKLAVSTKNKSFFNCDVLLNVKSVEV